ncbi:hypothetical protein J7L05_11290 [bacterium]|nr:hypothetical protein [bacterium]
MATYENTNDISQLIDSAITLQNRGLHLQSRHAFEKALSIDPSHPAVLKFFRIRTKRTDEHGDYYEEPEISCCCCPCCSGNLGECLCNLAICDFCCIPGGCCVIR